MYFISFPSLFFPHRKYYSAIRYIVKIYTNIRCAVLGYGIGNLKWKVVLMNKHFREYPQSYYGLLAILSSGPQTGYDIRKFLEEPDVFYWKESYGNIYPMLRTLENDGLITRRDSFVKTRKKSIYQLNEFGWEVLNHWLEQPAGLSRFRVEILMKIRFGSSSGVANMMEQIRIYREHSVKELEEARDNSRVIRSSSDTLSSDLSLVASLFLENLKESSIRWCDQSLEILEKWLDSRDGKAHEPVGDLPGESSVVSMPHMDVPLIE